jgi:alpha-amylase/alpha-mannosidase (GH57 family)
MGRLLAAVLLFVLVVAACTDSAEETTTTAAPVTTSTALATTTTFPAEYTGPPLYVNLIWHQHQPFYPKGADGVYTRPWVRVHATKDYYDMAAMVDAYPGLNVTFNLTPVLLQQLEDLAGGAKDIYWTMSETPAADLTAEQSTFVLQRFFDVNPQIIARFPRFQELADNRTSIENPQDLLDLQVLFNLAWTDLGFLAEEPLASLVAKGRDFTEEEKAVVLAEHLRIIQQTIPLHARLWEEGVIEVITTPLAHPILPLISDTDLAVIGDPTALLPDDRFREIADADQHVIRGLDVAEDLLGSRPVGMWPGEGSVAELVMGLFSKDGVEWVATGEDVLAQSLGIGSFTRNAAETVTEGDLLYRPWAAEPNRPPNVAMFFRDVRLSDLIGFEYSGMEAGEAAEDFLGRLAAIRDSLDMQAATDAGRPYIVSVILDGENAWEHYPNDGKDFLDALYTALTSTDWIETITPSTYLERFGEPEILEEVFPASWFQPNFATWIGEEEEATAWDYLYDVRGDLRAAEQSGDHSPESIAAAYEKMLYAEGSDWFWWYGADQESGDDGYFDSAFRELLGQVYDELGKDRPTFVGVPIIPQQSVPADQAPADLISITIDGEVDAGWSSAGGYGDTVPGGVDWAFDKDNLYLRVGLGAGGRFDVYLGTPGGSTRAVSLEGSVLGFGASRVLRWNGATSCVLSPITAEAAPEDCVGVESAVLDGGGIEFAVPLETLGPLEPGDTILAKVADHDRLVPPDGPMAFQVPDISNVAVFLDVNDPIGDDHGPGPYTYPSDAVFIPGSYDLVRFQAGTENEDLVFTFETVAPIQNPWSSPRGFSVQTFDIYIDTDPGAGTGARTLIAGRNAVLEDGNGWEYGITVEGWAPAVFVAAPDGETEETNPSFDVVTFGDKGKVVVRIPLDVFGGGDPTTWGYAAVVLSQEGFPSTGVRRVRDVEASAQQWRLGGAPSDINHTRVIDVAYADPGVQEAGLSDYAPATSGSLDDLGPDDFGKVPLNLPD